MVLVEVTRIYGRSNHWIDRIIDRFGSLMTDLIMMTAFDLVMMRMDQLDTIRRFWVGVGRTIVLS